MVGALAPVLGEGGGPGELRGDVLDGAVVGRGDDDLVAGQPGVEGGDVALVAALAVLALPGAADEGVLGAPEGGHHGGPFDHEGGDQVAQHGGLAGAGRAVDGEEAAVGVGGARIGEHAVDRELLAERERVLGLRGPAPGGVEDRVDAVEHRTAVLAQVGPGQDGDVTAGGQVGVESGAEAAPVVPERSADPGEVGGQEAVEEGLRGRGLGLGVAREVDEPALDADHARVEAALDAAEVGDLGRSARDGAPRRGVAYPCGDERAGDGARHPIAVDLIGALPMRELQALANTVRPWARIG
ncbi:hypothetical protein [Kitasatospora cathayae]|uniref:Uncharacterized protein n=1 Tax=Kitasatospora cathayae TaxID=3004092 RepID=A0ABY7QH46_9ACTN|nr:hypothetical protein [Kitasatospora sp. HUAS 3-15]WBP92133.1 hypothetical protein O1G21_40655 [Kitasatospora sp. HUAS 3-15]